MNENQLIFNIPLKKGETSIFQRSSLHDVVLNKYETGDKIQNNEKNGGNLVSELINGSSSLNHKNNTFNAQTIKESTYITIALQREDEDSISDSEDENMSTDVISVTEDMELISNRNYIVEVDEIFQTPVTNDGIFVDAAISFQNKQKRYKKLSKKSKINHMYQDISQIPLETPESYFQSSRHAHFTRLGMILRNLELKEQSLALQKKKDDESNESVISETMIVQPGTNKRYDSEDSENEGNDNDSFIDDTDYDKYVSGMAEINPVYYNHGNNDWSRDLLMDDYNQDDLDEDDERNIADSDTEIEASQNSEKQKKDKQVKKRGKKIQNIIFSEELEDSLKKLEDKLQLLNSTTYKDNEPKFIPFEDIKDELIDVSINQDQTLNQGIPQALLLRIKSMPIIGNFGILTIKSIIKSLLSQKKAQELESKMPQLKEKLNKLSTDDLIEALIRKIKNQAEREKLKNEYLNKSKEELFSIYNSSEKPSRVRWSKNTEDVFNEIIENLKSYITETNNFRKIPRGRGSKPQKLLSYSSLEKKLFQEIKSFWPKQQEFKKKIAKKENESPNQDGKKRKKKSKDEESSNDNSSTKKRNKKKDQSDSECKTKELNNENEVKIKKKKTKADIIVDKLESPEKKKRKRVSIEKFMKKKVLIQSTSDQDTNNTSQANISIQSDELSDIATPLNASQQSIDFIQ